MKGTCKLCLRERELQKRCHIYPKFVVKKSGSTLHQQKPNGKFGTQQDFYAEHYFCRECENDVFNKWGEDPVSDGYRFPEKLDNVPLVALEHFGLSTVYKALMWLKKDVPEAAFKAEECWRRKILERRSAGSCHPIRCIPTFECPSHPVATVLNRTYNMRIVEEEDFRLVWLNMPGFLMAGFSDFRRQCSEGELNTAFEKTAKSEAIRLSSQAEKLTLLRDH